MKFLCITTMLLNQSSFYFGSDKRDLSSLKRATEVCKTDERYKDQPCLRKFLKRENGVYWALCGEKEVI